MQVRLYEKINKAFAPLEFFTTHQWRFISNNPIHLMEEMTTEDQEMFYFDVRKINWQNYFENYILGIRQIVFKEDLSTLPLAKRNFKRYGTYRSKLCYFRNLRLKFMLRFLDYTSCDRFFYFLC